MAKDFKIQTRFTGIDGLSRMTKTIAKNFKVVTRAALGTNKVIKSIGKNAKRMGQSLRSASLAGAIGLTAALAPIVAFSDQINELEAVSMASTQQMSAMTAQAKQLGSTTRFSASQAAGAQTFLARAGFETNQILAATPDVLNLAAASNMELARTADMASNIMGAFKIEASDMARVADVLAATTSSANVDLEQLAESLKFAAPIAKKAGLSLEETAGAVGLLGNIGIQGTMAGTALRRMLTLLAAPTSSAAKMMANLGVKTTDAAGNLRKLPAILGDMSKGIQKLPSGSQIAAINEMFGLLGITAGAELIDQASLGNLDKLAKKLMNVEGRAKTMAETMNKGPGGALRMLKSAAEGLAISIGDAGLTGQFTKIVNKVTAFTSQLSQSEAATLANVAIFLVFLAALAPVLLAIGSLTGIMAPLVAGLVWLGGIIGTFLLPLLAKLVIGFLAVLAANPFLLLIIGAVAITAAFLFVKRNWDKIVQGFKTGIDLITGFFSGLFGVISEIISTVGTIGGLFGKTILSTESTVKTEEGERQSIPAQMAANQASAQASANARVEFVGTPGQGVLLTGGSGEELDPENGITAIAGF